MVTRLWKNVRVMMTKNKMQYFIAKDFWGLVDKHGPLPPVYAVKEYPEIVGTRCWEWTGDILPNGYGYIYLDGKTVLVHRFAWLLKHEKLSKKTPYVLHKCDNRKCVRHLWSGTQKDNLADMTSKGRRSCGTKHARAQAKTRSRGPSHSLAIQGESHSKLTTKEVFSIRSLAKDGLLTRAALGEMFGVSKACINMIVWRKNWKHI